MPQTIALSLISHTNVGKTTLARTLLGRDVGVVRDEAHVTETAEAYPMVETADGDRLVLWDTPGFGDSARLARRLAASGEPIGWFLSQVWDRFRDRAFWSSQQAVRNVRDSADVVLYLVNASEQPEGAGYVAGEMQVLDWIGKPVVVLLNQMGPPRAAADEAADVQAWRSRLAGAPLVRAVLPLDAFARCWVQEATLLRTIESVLPEAARTACTRLVDRWLERRRSVFDSSMAALAERLARAAVDFEPLPDGGVLGRLRGVGAALGTLRAEQDDGGATAPSRRQAMRRLAERLDADMRTGIARLIALHGLEGHASGEVLARLAEHYSVSERLDEGKAAMLGGVVTGALAGLKADLVAGGLTFGAGMLTGGIVGALGAFGLARGYNVVRGTQSSSVAWTDAAMDEMVAAALLEYLAVAHYGRGRGDWAASECPPHWRDVVADVLRRHRGEFEPIWALRAQADAEASLKAALRPALSTAAMTVLERLYPGSSGSISPR
ncbi:MAG: DUF3482 domain-containing protein [Burkholderiaceae bacterium]